MKLSIITITFNNLIRQKEYTAVCNASTNDYDPINRLNNTMITSSYLTSNSDSLYQTISTVESQQSACANFIFDSTYFTSSSPSNALITFLLNLCMKELIKQQYSTLGCITCSMLNFTSLSTTITNINDDLCSVNPISRRLLNSRNLQSSNSSTTSNSTSTPVKPSSNIVFIPLCLVQDIVCNSNFLFTPDRARTPVKVLSGGERNRLFLARLFTKPSNFLVMDEPTNDLDIETQELLEELLMEYSGTIILVSHDRSFLNNVVTSTIVLEGQGEIYEYAGGYDDWLDQKKLKEKPQSIKSQTSKVKTEQPKSEKKISYNEEKELESLPTKIQRLEEEQMKLHTMFADSSFYQKSPQEIAKTQQRSEILAQELLEAYERWEYLASL